MLFYAFFLAYIKILLYLCNRKRNKLNPKSRKGTKVMKTIAEKTYSNYNKVMSVKASHRNWNYIVLVRVGEYYESYEEDADIVSGVCGVGQFNHRVASLTWQSSERTCWTFIFQSW